MVESARPRPAAVTGIVICVLAPAASWTLRRVASAAHQQTGPLHVEIDGVSAGRALDVVDLEMEARLVADGEEARQRRLGHDRIAHDARRRWPGRCGRSDQATPITRTEPLKAGSSKSTFAIAVRRRPSPRRNSGRPAPASASRHRARGAASPPSADARRGVPCMPSISIPVEIAQIMAELALAEEESARIGALVAGEIEDADIDGGERDEGLLARAHAGRP